MMVDTLTIARELRAADLQSGQAEAIAAAIGRSVTETAATKSDLELAKQELRADIQQVRTDLGPALNRQLTWIISALVALSGLIIAVVKL